MSVPTAQVITSQAVVQGDVAVRPVIPVVPGQTIAARVVTNSDGKLELAIGGQRLVAMSDVPLEPGEAIRVVVRAVDEQRVTLQLMARGDGSGQAAAAQGAGGPAPGSPQSRPSGLSPQTAQTLFSVLADLGAADVDAPGPDGVAARQAFAARAADAGVSTPAQAAAFARLAAAGLPTTPAAVAGMAELAEGPPLGRALALIVGPDASPAPTQAAQASQAAANAQAAATAAPADEAAPGRVTPTPAPADATRAAATGRAAAPDGAMSQLAAVVRDVAEAAASGDPARLRDAVSRLGHGLEARLAHGTDGGEPDVRTALLSVAQSPDAPPHARAMAERAADALGAQALVSPALNPWADPSQQGAYLQMPLPGGQTAQVHVNPDAGGDGEGGDGARATRVAFVLSLSRLGPLVVEASVGPGGVDAVVRAQAPAVREYLVGQTGELAEGLARAVPDGPRPRVSVERLGQGADAAIIPPPPASGLNLSA